MTFFVAKNKKNENICVSSLKNGEKSCKIF